MTALQKTTDPAQVKIEDAPGVGKPYYPSGGRCNWKRALIISLVVLFVVGNVAALYALHFADRPSPTTRFSVATFAQDASAAKGDVVSFNTNAALRKGAGTTAYLDALTLGATNDSVTYKYLNFAPLGTSSSYYATNLVSYTRETTTSSASTTESVLTTVAFDSDSKSLTLQAAPTANTLSGVAIRGVVTLSDSLAVVLTNAGWSTTAVMPATISGGVATLLPDKVQTVTSSAANFIGAISASAFVVGYYDTYSSTAPYGQRVRAGMVASDGTITFSSNTATFAPNNSVVSSPMTLTTFGSPVRIPAASASGVFVIPYFQTANSSAVGLCVTKGAFDVSTNSLAAFANDTCRTEFMPQYFLHSVLLTDSALAIAFYDSANNNALTIATVAYTTSDGLLHFRSSYVLPGASGDFDTGLGGDFSAEPSLRVLPGNRLAVAVFNPANAGKPSVQVLRFSPETLAIRGEATPLLAVARPAFSLVAPAEAYSGITMDLVPMSADGFAFGYIGVGGDGAKHHFFSVVEAFGAPVGVLHRYGGKTKATVTVSGKAKVDDLVEGARYYAVTNGDVVTPASSATPSNSSDYFYTSGDAMLVTVDSLVGLAVDDDQLFVSQTA